MGERMKYKPVQIGEILGRLKIINILEQRDKHGNKLFLCECTCGNKITRAGNILRNGHVRSCGCMQKERIRKIAISKRKLPGESAYNFIECGYKRNARKRGYSWELTREQFREIINKNCYICNNEPILKNRFINKTTGLRRIQNNNNRKISDEWVKQNWVKANGIDRIDNNLGYTVGNSVSCCEKCNKMKLDHNYNEFLNHIKQIIVFQESKK